MGCALDGSRDLTGSDPSIDEIDMLDFVDGVGTSLPILLIDEVMVESRGMEIGG